MVLHLLLTILALIMGWWLSWYVFFVHVGVSVLLWVYSNNFKRLPFIGNFTVGILTGMCVYVVGVYYGDYPWSLYVYSGFAFFFTLVREIVKDLEDRFGDARYGCKTLPVIWGVNKTKTFIAFLMGVFSVVLLFLNYPLTSPNKTLYILIIYILEVVLFVILYRADKIRDFARLSNYCKVVILLGILSMVFNTGIEW